MFTLRHIFHITPYTFSSFHSHTLSPSIHSYFSTFTTTSTVSTVSTDIEHTLSQIQSFLPKKNIVVITGAGISTGK